MKRALLLLAEGFEEVETVTPIDFLRRAGIEVTIAGVTGKRVTGGHGIEISADRVMDDLPADVDALLIPGGMPGASNIAKSEAANKLIRRMYGEGKLVAALCAAPAVVLYPLGILDGKRMTCYPGFEEGLTKARFSEERVVTDGTIITSRGPGTAAEFAEAVIAYLLDDSAAREIRSRTLQPA